MQENNFEKQVQQKMDELKVNPSAEVWKHVEAVIGRKKKDRRILLLFLFVILGLLTAGIGWWNNTGTSNKKISIQQTSKTIEEKNINSGEISTAAASVDRVNTENQLKENNTTSKNIDNSDDERAGKTSTTITAGIKKNSEQQSNSTVKDDELSIRENTAYAKRKSKRHNRKSKANIDITPGDRGEVSVEENIEEAYKLQQMLFTPELNKQQLLRSHQLITQQQENMPPLTKPVYKELKKKPVSKWSFGLNLSMGISSTSVGYFGIAGDDEKANDALYTSGSGSQPPPAGAKIAPVVKLSTGYVAGVFVQRKLTDRISISSGLNYKHYSTKISVGSSFDSVFNNANNLRFEYRNGDRSKQTNYFHFIEIPLELNWRITKLKQLPLYLSTGINLSQMISSNALQYEPGTGNYYRDNSLFNKTKFGASVRLLFGVNKNGSFLLGPDFNYSLGSMAGRGLYNGRHYSYLGLRLQKSLGKK